MDEFWLSFDLAKKACENKTATLAIPNTIEEFDFLKTMFVENNRTAPIQYAWVCCIILIKQ